MNNKNESTKNGDDSQPPKVKLNFNPEDHDRKVEHRLSEAAKSKTRSLISRAYAEWKRRLQRRIKKGEVKTRQELIAELYDLHAIVGRDATGPEMYEWRTFTMEIIEDKVSELIISNGWQLNVFAEFPADGTSTALSIPQRYTFSTIEELREVKPIKLLNGKEDFIGIVREQKTLFAFYEGGELVPIGAVLKLDDQVKRLPTRHEMARELAKLPKE